jgi:GDP-L-fucose synthase
MEDMMDLKDKRILVTGGSGLVGTHLQAELTARGAKNIVCPRSKEFDLREPEEVEAMFRDAKPQVVFSLAARVGGILDNKNYPADFYFDNIRIGAYLFDSCARHKVEKLINLGAGCGYPLQLAEPLREENFWDGYPQPESAGYSLAKKMLVVQGITYRQQYGLNAITLIPSNLYGANDNFNLEQAHAIPALLRKFYEATQEDWNQVEVWGNGSAKRDFIHAADVATALVDTAQSYDQSLPLNIAYGRQHSIREVVELLTTISGFRGRVFWNENKPSGQSSREFSLANLQRYLPGFRPRIDLKEGLTRTYRWLADNYATGAARL